MSDAEKCDPEVYENGEAVAIADCPSKTMEPWVTQVRQASGQRVDWHYMGGRAVVRFLGDRAKVVAAIDMCRATFPGESLQIWESA